MAHPPTPSPSLPPYQTRLSFFASSPSLHAPLHITLLTALRRSLSLGLNFPVSLLLAISLRLLCHGRDVRKPSPRDHPLLNDVQLPAENALTRVDLMAATRGKPLPYRLRTLGIWAVAADERNGVLRPRDVEDIRKGTIYWRVAGRRRIRRPDDGNVLPFWRGGPISVSGHAWAVRRFFGVAVYEKHAVAGEGRKAE